MNTIEKIAVVGAGIMGHGIAQVFAQCGKSIVLIDSETKVLEDAKIKITKNAGMLITEGLLNNASVEEIFGRIVFTTDLAEAKDADMIIEAIPEKFHLKEALFKNLEIYCRPTTIFATNTSGIPVTSLANIVERPDRVIGTHFFMPAQLIPLVEVIQTDKTCGTVIEKVVALLQEAGKKCVRVKKDIPGFIGNRLQHALAREAMSLAQSGVASVEDIDTVVKTSLAMRLIFTGPLEQRDLNGLDTHISITEYLYPDLEDAEQPLEILRSKVAAGEFGLKTGKGFYDWKGRTSLEVNEEKNLNLINLLKFLK